MPMRRKKATEGMGLAFLDIMSCGLGAVILIFMLVKQHVEKEVSDTVAVQDLSSNIESLEQQKQELASNLQGLIDEHQARQAELASSKSKISKQSQALTQKSLELDAETRQLAQMQQQIVERLQTERSQQKQDQEQLAKHAEDKVSLKGQGEEEYLIGLKMEGKKILILVDSSASMTAQRVIDVIRYKVGSDAQKQGAPKWQRVLRSVAWMLARLPPDSQFAVISYAKEATLLGGGSWQNSTDKIAFSRVLGELGKIIPQDTTNLEAGLGKAATMNPDTLYLITDGLPTSSSSRSFGIGACQTLFSKKTISGECRIALFRKTINAIRLTGTRINTILFPIEGDPQSSYEYWQWASSHGGLLIKPSPSWP
ncbi:MAG: vWA domain-containing protein [Candidatus Eutrophobiaceae bacterium]